MSFCIKIPETVFARAIGTHESFGILLKVVWRTCGCGMWVVVVGVEGCAQKKHVCTK